MSIHTIKVIHPGWYGKLQLSTSDSTVYHLNVGSTGSYTLNDDKLIIDWDKYPTETFFKSDFGLYIQNSVKPEKLTNVDALNVVLIGGRPVAISKISVSIDDDYEVSLRLGTTDIPTFEQVFVRQEYESPNLPATAKTIIDLGANVGLATVFFAQKYKGAKILAVEPEAENFRALENNVRALGNRVSTLKGAVWHEDGEINLNVDAEDGSPLGSWGVQVSAQAWKGSGATPCWKLSTLMEKFAFDEVDILKIDIEGAELELFSEKPELWLTKAKLIVVETHDRFRPGSDQAVHKALATNFDELPSNGENLYFRRKQL